MAWLTLDIRSLIVLLDFANLLAVLLMTCAAWPRVLEGPDRSFVTGKLILVFGWALLTMRGQVLDLLSAHLGNAFLFFGFALEASAFLGIAGRRRWHQGFLSLAALGAIAFWCSGNNPTRWVVMASLTAAAIYGTVGVELTLRRGGSRLRGTIGLLFSFSSLVLVLRAMEALTVRTGFTLMSRSVIQSLTFLALFLLTITGISGFILLTKEREEQLLQDSEARFSTLFHASPCAMLLTRMEDGRLLDVNEQFEAWTEYTRGEALGRVTLELGIFGGDPAAREAFVTQLRSRGQVREMEIDFRRKSGGTARRPGVLGHTHCQRRETHPRRSQRHHGAQAPGGGARADDRRAPEGPGRCPDPEGHAADLRLVQADPRRHRLLEPDRALPPGPQPGGVHPRALPGLRRGLPPRHPAQGTGLMPR